MNRRNSQLILFLLITLIAWTVTVIPQSTKKHDDRLRIAFLDVGQGDSIFLTTPHNQQILIDGGPNSTVLSKLGKEMPFYDRTIDLVIVSHNHSDHIAGLNRVLERYQVNQIWISGAIHTTNEYIKLLELIRDRHIPTEIVWTGKTVQIDGVQLNVVHPISSTEGLRPDDQHDATIVVRAQYGEDSFLFTGDIDEGHEQEIIKSGATISADVLKIPHHGSASGLALNFLNLVNPQYAVIQSGKDNNYGHPVPSILQKLNDRGVTIYRNDVHGTIWATTDGKAITWKTERE